MAEGEDSRRFGNEPEGAYAWTVTDPAGVYYSVQAVTVSGGHGPARIGVDGRHPQLQKAVTIATSLLGGVQQAKRGGSAGVMVYQGRDAENATQVFYSDGLDMAEARKRASAIVDSIRAGTFVPDEPRPPS